MADPPTITPATSSRYYLIGSNSQPVNPNASVTSQSGVNFDGGALAVSFGTGATAIDMLSIPATTTNADSSLIKVTTVNSLSSIFYQVDAASPQVLIGTYTSSTSALNISLTQSTALPAGFHITAPIMTELIDAILYKNTSTTPENSIAVNDSVTDANGLLSATATTTITIIGAPSVNVPNQILKVTPGLQTIHLGQYLQPGTNETTLVISGVMSSNVSFIPDAAIANGQTSDPILTFTPADGQSDSATITLIGTDHNLTFTLGMFTVTTTFSPSITPTTSTQYYQVSSGFHPVNSNALVTSQSGANFDGGTLTVSFGTGATAVDQLRVPPNNNITPNRDGSFINVSDNGTTSTIYYRANSGAPMPGTVIGTFPDSTSALTITFAQPTGFHVTAAIVTELIDAIQYENTSTTPENSIAVNDVLIDANALIASNSTTIDIVTAPKLTGSIADQRAFSGTSITRSCSRS